jgi:hypothetical protein
MSVRALSQIESAHTEMIGCDIPRAPIDIANDNLGVSAKVCIYRGENCILSKDFQRSHLAVGRSLQSDIVLQDSGISRHHVDIYLENQKVFLFVAPQKKALRISGQTVRAALIEPDDTIELGPYTLTIQTGSGNETSDFGDDLRYQVVFEGKIQEEKQPDQVAKNLKKWLKHDDRQTAAFIEGSPVVIQKNLTLQAAIALKSAFEESGAVGQVQAITGPDQIDTTPDETKSVTPLFSDLELDLKHVSLDRPRAHLKPIPAAIEDEDEEDDDFEADFSLKEILSRFDKNDGFHRNGATSSNRQLGVFKFLDNTVLDVCYLDSKQHYYIQNYSSRFRLTQKNGSDTSYIYFSKDFTGTVRTKSSGSVSITDLLVDDNLYHKRRGIYRHALSDSDEAFINDGRHDYLIRPIQPSKSPAVSKNPPVKELSWKHGLISLVVHLLFLTILTLLPASQPKELPEPETRFVQVDPQLLDKLQEKQKPVVKPTPQKPKPVLKKEPVKKKKAIKKITRAKKKPAKVSKAPIKTATRQSTSKSNQKTRQPVVSKHPKAGGGHGNGNTINRNVNQVGILSMLGDSKGPQVQTAIADVTNLDAVKSVNSGQAKFKVGGIKGKLGTSEISVTGGDVVATKGNSQVLRSYGAGGDGRVAALKKGNVGQKKVMGMVQARLNKSVRIRGGMSREEVKRVIEQHLDEITYCYETALISNPSIKGKITMEWKILMSGKVGEVRIKSSTIKSPEIYSCIKSAIKTWQFPKPVGNEVVVSYPFIFDIVGF